MGTFADFNNYLRDRTSDPRASAGIREFAAALLQNSGYSTMPTTFGQVLGTAMSASNNALRQYDEAALKNRFNEAQIKRLEQAYQFDAARAMREQDEYALQKQGRADLRRLLGLPSRLEEMGPPSQAGEYGQRIAPGSGYLGGQMGVDELLAGLAGIPGFEDNATAALLEMTKPKAPQTLTLQEGRDEVTYQVFPDGTRKEIARGPKWNPNPPPTNISFSSPVQGVGPDGMPQLYMPSNTGQMLPTGIQPPKPKPKALSPKVQEDLAGAQQMLMALDAIERNIDQSGLVQGLVSKGQAKLGMNQKAIEFETAKNNLKVLAQSLIKGVPSNMDIQTFIATLPDITAAEPVNYERLRFTKDSVRTLINDTINFYESQGQEIPAQYKQLQAKINAQRAPESSGGWSVRRLP